MSVLYDFFIAILSLGIRLGSLFSPKLRLFVRGRRDWRERLTQKRAQFSPDDKVVWFHAASLGEFEQGRPLIEKIKREKPGARIVVTFFSPSGYEIRKDYPLADVVCYLPLDTPRNARDFIEIVRPSAVVFIKYEFWANYLNALGERKVPLFLVSGIFRPGQVFFRPWGGFMRRVLKNFTFFYLQNRPSVELLEGIGLKNTALTGDTRFDRVCDLLDQDPSLDFMEEFSPEGSFMTVCGSTWPEDERMIAALVNSTGEDPDQKFVIAPHNIRQEQIEELEKLLNVPSVRYSQRQGKKLEEYKVLILDTIGILTRVYSYGKMACVGGGFTRSGIHNILEAAVYGIPVITGPNIRKFEEARALKKEGGLFTVATREELQSIYFKFLKDEPLRLTTGEKASAFVRQGRGATERIYRDLTCYL